MIPVDCSLKPTLAKAKRLVRVVYGSEFDDMQIIGQSSDRVDVVSWQTFQHPKHITFNAAASLLSVFCNVPGH